MLKRLLVPTLVLTVAGFMGAGCHDSSGNGTKVPTGAAGSTGGDGAAGADGSASDVPAGDTATEAGATEGGGDTATEGGTPDTHGDTATEGGTADVVGEAGLDLDLGVDLGAIGN